MTEFRILTENNEKDIIKLTDKLISDYNIKEEHVYEENNKSGETVNIFTFSEFYKNCKGYEDYNGLKALYSKSKKNYVSNVRKLEDLKEFWGDRFLFILKIPYKFESFGESHLKGINELIVGNKYKIQGFRYGVKEKKDFNIHVPVTKVNTGGRFSKKSYKVYDTLCTYIYEKKQNARVVVPIDSLVIEGFRETVKQVYSVLKE